MEISGARFYLNDSHSDRSGTDTHWLWHALRCCPSLFSPPPWTAHFPWSLQDWPPSKTSLTNVLVSQKDSAIYLITALQQKCYNRRFLGLNFSWTLQAARRSFAVEKSNRLYSVVSAYFYLGNWKNTHCKFWASSVNSLNCFFTWLTFQWWRTDKRQRKAANLEVCEAITEYHSAW